MTTIDWIAVAVVVLTALNGLRTGLVVGVLSLAGLLVGAYLGSRLAPALLSGGDSAYTPLVALAGAVGIAIVVQSFATYAGGTIRRSLFVLPPLRVLDTAGGVVLGAVTGLAFVWVLGAVALHLPGQTGLRHQVQSSKILGRLNEEVPPSTLLDALQRVDPFAAIAGPGARVAPPDPRLLADPGVRSARGSVVRVTGTACGLGIEGSGWIVRQGLVVTNAHVVAGVRDAEVDRHDGRFQGTTALFFDPHDDIAILRVPGLEGTPLAFADPTSGLPVAILGYPDNGALTAAPGRIGQTARVLTEDAYGRGPVPRTVTTLRGLVRHGNSGGPAVDSAGRVRATIFATRVGSDGGYGIPKAEITRALSNLHGSVSTGDCVR